MTRDEAIAALVKAYDKTWTDGAEWTIGRARLDVARMEILAEYVANILRQPPKATETPATPAEKPEPSTRDRCVSKWVAAKFQVAPDQLRKSNPEEAVGCMLMMGESVETLARDYQAALDLCRQIQREEVKP